MLQRHDQLISEVIMNLAAKTSEAPLGREGWRSAPFCVLKNLKRWVRAAHGCAREAKTHYYEIRSKVPENIEHTMHIKAALT